MTTPRATPPAAGPAAPAATAAPRAQGAGQPGNGAVAAARPEPARRRARGQRRPPRLASLQLKRVDPWTVLKISLIVAVVMFFVWMIAVAVLYLSLGSMNVWKSINDTWVTLTSADTKTGSDLITPLRVFSITAVIGAINIVLFTALATIAAFVYNAAAGMSGGVEVTLGERD